MFQQPRGDPHGSLQLAAVLARDHLSDCRVQPSLDALLSRSDAVLMDLLASARATPAAAMNYNASARATIWPPAEQRRIAASAAVLASLLQPFSTPSHHSPFSQP
jgi:hypothetical protein